MNITNATRSTVAALGIACLVGCGGSESDQVYKIEGKWGVVSKDGCALNDLLYYSFNDLDVRIISEHQDIIIGLNPVYRKRKDVISIVWDENYKNSIGKREIEFKIIDNFLYPISVKFNETPWMNKDVQIKQFAVEKCK